MCVYVCVCVSVCVCVCVYAWVHVHMIRREWARVCESGGYRDGDETAGSAGAAVHPVPAAAHPHPGTCP